MDRILRYLGILFLVFLILATYIYFLKPYQRRQEIMRHVSEYHIPDVSLECYEMFEYLSEENEINFKVDEYKRLSDKCHSEVSKYSNDIVRWNNMIRTNNDLNCSDFLNKSDATDFYHYISGELSTYFRALNTNPTPDTFGFRYPGALKCEYDPYTLDADDDCIPCESY